MMFLGAIDYIGWDPMENPPQWIMLAVELLCHKGHPTLGGERSGFPGPFEPKAPPGCERWKDMVFKILNLMLCNLELDHTRSRCFYNDDYNTLIPHSYPPGHGSWYFLIRKIEAFSP